MAEFKHVFEHFSTPAKNGDDKKKQDEGKEGDSDDEADAFTKTEKREKKEEKKMSKKQRKLIARMKVFDLKMKVRRPDMVEAWDVTSKDPQFLMDMKMVRNSVPVPRHWCQKRRYLQYKRGVHKTPFKLPEFIESTGITKVREQANDKNKTLKQKMRERMQPKMGKIDIDYQILHDAFFKNQKKPKLTHHGDLYYEGKEYEIRMRGYKPGRLSPDLRMALGIPDNSPPPWIINMQRYGPPPAYPNLKIPGVNAPIPESIAYGYGRLFTDDKGFTVYADCHGLNKAVY
jgi:splicing factor 3B subunit 2